MRICDNRDKADKRLETEILQVRSDEVQITIFPTLYCSIEKPLILPVDFDTRSSANNCFRHHLRNSNSDISVMPKSIDDTKFSEILQFESLTLNVPLTLELVELYT